MILFFPHMSSVCVCVYEDVLRLQWAKQPMKCSIAHSDKYIDQWALSSLLSSSSASLFIFFFLSLSLLACCSSNFFRCFSRKSTGRFGMPFKWEVLLPHPTYVSQWLRLSMYVGYTLHYIFMHFSILFEFAHLLHRIPQGGKTLFYFIYIGLVNRRCATLFFSFIAILMLLKWEAKN